MPCCNNHPFDRNMYKETQERTSLNYMNLMSPQTETCESVAYSNQQKFKGNAYMTSVCRIYTVLFRNSLRALLNIHAHGHHDAFAPLFVFMLYFQCCLFARGRWVLLPCRPPLSSALCFRSYSSHHPEFSWD